MVDALQNASMWERTLLLWSSDNGGASSEAANNYPLRGQKGRASWWKAPSALRVTPPPRGA